MISVMVLVVLSQVFKPREIILEPGELNPFQRHARSARVRPVTRAVQIDTRGKVGELGALERQPSPKQGERDGRLLSFFLAPRDAE
jgi:hypothetical protein